MADRSRIQEVQLAVSAKPSEANLPFWRAVLQVVLAATDDFTAATRAALLVLVVSTVVGVTAAVLMRRETGVRDSAGASDPGLPVTRPS